MKGSYLPFEFSNFYYRDALTQSEIETIKKQVNLGIKPNLNFKNPKSLVRAHQLVNDYSDYLNYLNNFKYVETA